MGWLPPPRMVPPEFEALTADPMHGKNGADGGIDPLETVAKRRRHKAVRAHGDGPERRRRSGRGGPTGKTVPPDNEGDSHSRSLSEESPSPLYLRFGPRRGPGPFPRGFRFPCFAQGSFVCEGGEASGMSFASVTT